MINKIFPFLKWIKGYTKKTFGADLIAGLVLAIILIPKSMAYASLAGLPEVYGLYACLLAPAIAALWGSSKQLSTGPAAVISFLVFASVSQIATPGTEQFIAFAILLALLVGIIQITMSIFKLGFIMNFISHSVVIGFTNAAAIIIATSQLSNLLGIKVPQTEIWLENIIDIIKHIGNINWVVVGIGVASILLIKLGKKIHKFFPGGILAIVLFTFLTQFYGWSELYHVKIIGAIPSSFPTPSIPSFTFHAITQLIPMALVMAIIGFMEAYSIAKVIGAKTKQKIDINQELMGQGLANLVTGFFKGYPVSGSFSGTAVNYDAGAKTGISNVVATILIIISLLFLAKYLEFLPKAVLSAIVIVAVIGLFKPKEMLRLYKINKIDGFVAFFTFFIAFVIKSDYAIFLGVITALILFLYKTVVPKVSLLCRYRDINSFVEFEKAGPNYCPQILILRPERSLYFANVEYVFDKIKNYIQKAKVTKYVIVECESINYIDASALEYIKEFFETEKDLPKLIFVNLKKPLVENIRKAGILDIIGEDSIVYRKSNLIPKLYQEINKDICKNCKFKGSFKECE